MLPLVLISHQMELVRCCLAVRSLKTESLNKRWPNKRNNSSSMGVISVAKQAVQLKLDGNICFSKHQLGAAIDAYTEAITLCPNVSVYWSNRALCHMKRDDWTRAEEDCRRAIQLDHNSVKLAFPDAIYLVDAIQGG